MSEREARNLTGVGAKCPRCAGVLAFKPATRAVESCLRCSRCDGWFDVADSSTPRMGLLDESPLSRSSIVAAAFATSAGAHAAWYRGGARPTLGQLDKRR